MSFPRVIAAASASAWLAASLAAGCAPPRDSGARHDRAGGAAGAAATRIVDDFGDSVSLAPGSRIASLNPTTTELFYALGAADRLIGRDSYDEWPAAAKSLDDLGPGLGPNVEKILAAHPDVVVLYAANDNRGAARSLRAAGVRVVGLKIDRIADFRRAAMTLGALAGDTVAARAVADSVEGTLDRVRTATAALPHPRVLWYLWDNPILVLGNGSYQSELLAIAGGANVYADRPEAAAQVSLEDVLRRDPAVILLDSGKTELLRASPRWRNVAAVRDGRLYEIDDALLNRPGVTLGMAALSLARILHPEWKGP